jgi:hypothetical protein
MSADIVDFTGHSRLDHPPEKILSWAQEADLESVVVVGYTKDGDEYFASSKADAAQVVWHLQRAIWRLNKVCDRMAGPSGDDAA